jgi:octanoyl-[GcvH]:protein N-octanoyltransferase
MLLSALGGRYHGGGTGEPGCGSRGRAAGGYPRRVDRERLSLHRASFPGEAAYDMAVSAALLHAVARGGLSAALRLHRTDNALAFSVRDRLQPGFEKAVEGARRRGFQPVLRLAGGRAAVFHRETLGFAWALPAPEGAAAIARRSDEFAALAARALGALGVDARVGAVPDEYCPGPHSVNAGGRRKLIGLGQRLVRGAVYVGGVVVVGDADRVRGALLPVYQELGLTFDPASVGSVRDEIGPVGCDEVADALLAELAARYRLAESEIPEVVLAHARRLEPRHTVLPSG